MPLRRIVSPALCLASVLCLLTGSSGAAADNADQQAPAVSAPTAPVRAVMASGTSVSATAALGEVARGLESPVFEVRETATQRLLDAQAPAVPVLVATAKEGTLEAAIRAVAVLEAIYVSSDVKGDDAGVDTAEDALDELCRSARAPIADRAEVILEGHYDIRERHAVAEIERLHGKPNFDEPTDLPNGWNLRRNPGPGILDRSNDPSKEKRELTWLIIGPKWTGGDEGLKHVMRLKRLRMLYRIKGSSVSDEGIARLQAAIPGLEVQPRGAAKLGITNAGAFGDGHGCVIHNLQKGEAAANAGLRPEDRILQFDGHEVENFGMLIQLLRSYKPGDKVESIIERDQNLMRVTLTLTGWD